MNARSRLLFVAGDGASGRVAVNTIDACLDVYSDAEIELLVEAKAGAHALCLQENVPHAALRPTSDVRSLVAEWHAVISGFSGTAWELEHRVIRDAFALAVPAVLISDHPHSAGHEHLQSLLAHWERSGCPPFVVTAVNGHHEADLLRRFPRLENHVLLAGNPLNGALEALLPRISEARVEIRSRIGVREDAILAAVFLSGNTRTEFEEMVHMIGSAVLPGLKRLGTVPNVLVNFHHELDVFGDRVKRVLANWKSHARVVESISQDEMIVASDVVITSPFSTTSERAIACGVPLVQMGTPSNTALLHALTGKSHSYTPELASGVALWADGIEMFFHLLLRALDPERKRIRQEAAQKAGLVSPSGASQRIAHRIFALFRSST